MRASPAWWRKEQEDLHGKRDGPTHEDGPPLCQCGEPCKSYYPRCEDCWLEATRGCITSTPDRRPACLRFGADARQGRGE